MEQKIEIKIYVLSRERYNTFANELIIETLSQRLGHIFINTITGAFHISISHSQFIIPLKR